MWIKSLFNIVGKDLRIFLRSKFSALIILLAPLLIVLIAGFIFNSTGVSGVSVAVFSNLDTELMNNIISGLEDKNFDLQKYNSQDDCINSVKSNRAHICIIFPEDLTQTGSTQEIVFYTDQSRINLAYTLINELESTISVTSSEIGVTLAQNLIDILISTKNNLPSEISQISKAIQNSNEIISISEVESFSLNINNVISSLNESKELINNSEALDLIEDSLDKLLEIKESNLNVEEDLDEINNQSEEIKEILDEVSLNLERLIDSLNSLSVLEAEKIISPIKTKIEPINSNLKNRDYLLPIILSLIALFGGLLLSSTFVLKERKTKAYFRNFITPTSNSTFIFATYLTCMIILIVQFLIIFIGLWSFLDFYILNFLPEIVLILFISLTVFIFFGMFIGYLFRSDETTILASVLTATILMFFSNTIFPVETTGIFKKFLLMNPLVIVNDSLKKIILFGWHPFNFLEDIYLLGGFAILFIILTYFSRKITKRML